MARECDALLISTDTLKDNTLLDAAGMPHSGHLKVVETCRFCLDRIARGLPAIVGPR